MYTKFRIKKLLACLFIIGSFSFTSIDTQAGAPLIRSAPQVVKPGLSIILVESAAKARAIIRPINNGASQCARVALDERTSCVAQALKKAARAGNNVRFGNGTTARAISRAARAMRRLPDDGSKASFAQGRIIIDDLVARIVKHAGTRKPSYKRHQLAVSIALPKLKRPLRGGKA